MTSSLSNLANKLAKGIYKIKRKYWHYDKKCQTCGIKYKNCACFLENPSFKNNLIEYKYFNKNYQKTVNENLKK